MLASRPDKRRKSKPLLLEGAWTTINSNTYLVVLSASMPRRIIGIIKSGGDITEVLI
jgi:hypothetical protein